MIFDVSHIISLPHFDYRIYHIYHIYHIYYIYAHIIQGLSTTSKYEVNVGSFSVDSHCGVRVTPVLLPVPIVGLHGNRG